MCFIGGQRWGSELAARNSKSAVLEKLVRMAKEYLDATKEDGDFESDEENSAAIKEAEALLSGHRNALMEHLRTPQPTPTRVPAPAPSPAPPRSP